MSVAPTTSVASCPRPWPSWRPNMLAPDVRSICFIPAKPGMAVASWPPKFSAPSIASAMCAATGSTSRCQTGIVFSIQSARLQAATLALTLGKAVASSNQTSAMDADSANARRWPASGVGSGPSEATVLRAVSLVTAQLTPEPEPAEPPGKMEPAPPSMANAFCICCMKAFMSPPASDEKKASSGLSPAPEPKLDPPDPELPECEPEPKPPPSTQPWEPEEGLETSPDDSSPGCDSSSGRSSEPGCRSSAMPTPALGVRVQPYAACCRASPHRTRNRSERNGRTARLGFVGVFEGPAG